jgi:hypothetical protein
MIGAFRLVGGFLLYKLGERVLSYVVPSARLALG